MKVIILAGGFGTRLSEYTNRIPKPMVKVAGYPIVTYIMHHYMKFSFNEFILATGYKSEEFKKYFKNYKKDGKVFEALIFKRKCKITIVNTGLNTLTGGRIKKISKFLNKNEDFMFSYGDGVSNVNIKKLVNFHKKHNKMITVTAVRPPARFGELKLKNDKVKDFKEKPQVGSGWINGGFFVAKSNFISLIKGDRTILEKTPLEKATKLGQLYAYKHYGFWKCMDTKRDKDVLEKLIKKFV